MAGSSILFFIATGLIKQPMHQIVPCVTKASAAKHGSFYANHWHHSRVIPGLINVQLKLTLSMKFADWL